MAAPGPHAAFFYGTLMAPSVLYRVLYLSPKPTETQKQRTTSVSALLAGYQRRKVKGCDYPAITACEGGSVRGLLVTGLSDADVVHLDTFEGYQYEREVVRVKVLRDEAGNDDGEGQMVEAETYLWSREEGGGGLEDEEWDFEEFTRTKIHRWNGVMDWEDSGFDDVDRQVAEEEANDPTGGRGANGKIGKDLETLRSAV